MKLRYLFEHAIVGTAKEPRLEVAGIWVTGPGPDDLEFLFLPGYDELEGRAVAIVADQVENKLDTPPDMLERLQEGMPAYLGARGEIHETEAYDTLPAAAKGELKKLLAKHGLFYPWFFGDAPKPSE